MSLKHKHIKADAYKQPLPCKPGSIFYKIALNKDTNTYEIKEFRITKYTVTEHTLWMYSSPTQSLVHREYKETLAEFMGHSELTLEAAQSHADLMNRHTFK